MAYLIGNVIKYFNRCLLAFKTYIFAIILNGADDRHNFTETTSDVMKIMKCNCNHVLYGFCPAFWKACSNICIACNRSSIFLIFCFRLEKKTISISHCELSIYM